MNAGDPLLNGTAEDPDDLPHLGEDLRFLQIASRFLIFHCQLPEWGVAAAVMAEHFFTTLEWHRQTLARQHREHRRQPFDPLDAGDLSECSECFVADKLCGLNLHKLAASGLVEQNFVRLDQLL